MSWITLRCGTIVNSENVASIEVRDVVLNLQLSDGLIVNDVYASASAAKAALTAISALLSSQPPSNVPSITQAWPTAQGITGGFPTVIIGFNFQPGADIKINGVSQTGITFLDVRTYAFTTQPIAGGVYSVTYIGADGQTATGGSISFT